MRIILIKDIEKLGKEGEVLEVKDGFARNFLLPKKLAIPATEENLKHLELEKKRKLQQQEKEKQKAEEIAKKLDGLSINVAVQTHNEDELYGSVGPLEISKALQEEGFSIDKKSIILEEPIKKLGVFDCIVRLHPQVEAKIKVWVVRK